MGLSNHFDRYHKYMDCEHCKYLVIHNIDQCIQLDIDKLQSYQLIDIDHRFYKVNWHMDLDFHRIDLRNLADIDTYNYRFD